MSVVEDAIVTKQHIKRKNSKRSKKYSVYGTNTT